MRDAEVSPIVATECYGYSCSSSRARCCDIHLCCAVYDKVGLHKPS